MKSPLQLTYYFPCGTQLKALEKASVSLGAGLVLSNCFFPGSRPNFDAYLLRRRAREITEMDETVTVAAGLARQQIDPHDKWANPMR